MLLPAPPVSQNQDWSGRLHSLHAMTAPFTAMHQAWLSYQNVKFHRDLYSPLILCLGRQTVCHLCL